MNEISFTVKYPPTPWKRPAGARDRYDSQVFEKNTFGLLVKQQLVYSKFITSISKEPLFQKGVPIGVFLEFAMERPKGTMLDMPTNKSDLDNLCKFVMDSLQSGPMSGLVWHDDGQIVALTASKRWADCDYISCSIRKFTNE